MNMYMRRVYLVGVPIFTLPLLTYNVYNYGSYMTIATGFSVFSLIDTDKRLREMKIFFITNIAIKTTLYSIGWPIAITEGLINRRPLEKYFDPTYVLNVNDKTNEYL